MILIYHSKRGDEMKIIMRKPKYEIELLKLKGESIEVDMTNIAALGDSALTFLENLSENNYLTLTNVDSQAIYRQFEQYGIAHGESAEQISLF